MTEPDFAGAARAMTNAFPTVEQAAANLAANREALGGVSVADLMQPRDEYPAGILAMLPPGTALPRLPRCHRCNTVATTQWQRQATAAEADQHWAALEQHIRSQPDLLGHGNAEWTADRTQPVTQAVHGCDEHTVQDTVMLHAANCGGHQACQCEGDTADA